MAKKNTFDEESSYIEFFKVVAKFDWIESFC